MSLCGISENILRVAKEKRAACKANKVPVKATSGGVRDGWRLPVNLHVLYNSYHVTVSGLQ